MPTWNWKLLRCGEFWLDAGAMFGIIPRAVWSGWFPPDGPDAIDANNRMRMQTNSLLLESGGKLAVVEVGIGDKFGAKERGIYRQEDRAIHDALGEVGARCEDVSHVIVTHLHFDHAGGLTRRAPEAAPGGDEHSPVLTFPNARIIVQRREWEDALANRSTMSKTYLPNHLTPEVAQRVELIEGEREVLPGITVWPIPGHTWGQQGVRFMASDGRTVVFVPDVMPTARHARPTTNLAYDVESYTSMQERIRLLERAANEGWTLVLNHEPGNPVFRVERLKGAPVLVSA